MRAEPLNRETLIAEGLRDTLATEATLLRVSFLRGQLNSQPEPQASLAEALMGHF